MDGMLVILAGWGLVLSARGLGEWLLRLFRLEEPLRLPRMLWATGLGLGFLSLSTLGLGMLGHLRAPLALAALGLLLALPALRGDLVALRTGTRAFRWPTWEGILVAAALLVFVGTVLFAQLPQCDYDVLEYHLGAPQQYARLGQVEFLPWNVYASFPEDTEMLFLCMLSLFRSAVLGGMAAAALNVAVGVLCALAVADLARALFGAKAAVPAGVLFYVYPLTWNLSGICYVEIEQVFLSILCVRALVGSGGRRAALAGIFAGLAMGTKYPSAMFLALPLGLFLLASRGLRAAVVYGLAATLALSPWLVKNAVATHNPIYPLLGSVFHAKGWTPEKEARFSQAHHPPMPDGEEAWREFYASISGEQMNEEGEVTWRPPRVAILVLVAPLLLLLRGERGRWRAVGALMLLVGWHAAVWWLWTHRIDRFFYPAVPWLAVLGGAGLVGLSNEFLASAVKFMAALLVWFHAFFGVPSLLWNDRLEGERVLFFVIHGGPVRQFLGAFDGLAFDPIADMNDDLPPVARVLMVGEARTCYLRRDFLAATVFDDCPLATILGSPPIGATHAREALLKAGITHVYVNWGEVERLQRTYAYQFGGDVHLGYSPVVDPKLFRILEDGALEKVKAYGDVVPALGSEPVVLYRVAQ